jgi:hypothetical protein
MAFEGGFEEEEYDETKPNREGAFCFDWQMVESKGLHHARPEACIRKAAFLSRRATELAAAAGRRWPLCQDDETKPKRADWRLGTLGPRKRGAAAAARGIRNEANCGSWPKRIPLSAVYDAGAG